MADDRPAESEVGEIAKLKSDLADLRSTLLARVSRRPTGDVEATIRSTPKPDTLILNGQTPLRSAYPALWQWVQDQGLVISGLFTTGNGSTTFGLPDFSGLVLMGAGTLGTDTYTLGQKVGEARHVLSTAELPVHGHSVGVADHGTHNHGGTGGGGAHGHHISQVTFLAGTPAHGHSGGGGNLAEGSSPATGASGGSDTQGVGDHTHGIGADGPTGHTVSQSNVGSGTAHENRQPSLAINYLIWT